MTAKIFLLPLVGSLFALTGCLVGPTYQRPAAPVSPAYKEQPPASTAANPDWSKAQPGDGIVRGKWWQVYNDAELNALEEQVSISNQNLLSYEAQFREARDAVRVARSNLFPTVSVGPSITAAGSGSGLYNSGTGVTQVSSSRAASFDLPANVSWTADIWGGIRRTVRADVATAQATAAQLENARLAYQSTLALDYFQLRGLDSDEQLLQQTVASYNEYLQLTKDRFDAGVASDADVAEAEAQLETTNAAIVDLGVSRAAYEHAVSVLIGKPPSEISIGKTVLKTPPPSIPVGLPSALLQRRPDIAQYERQIAAANEEIGVAKAAYYPTVTLSASAGFENTSIKNWFTWPSRFWSVGPTLSETVFDGGRRHAQVAQAQHAYEATVANYRQTVLTAFQQVEDELAALRILENETSVLDRAVSAATRSLDVSTEQYKAGTVNYLNVLTAQTTLLSAQRSAVDVLTRRVTSSVSLVEALGGGWDAGTLPASDQIVKSH